MVLLLALFTSITFATSFPIKGVLPQSTELSDLACHTKEICAVVADEGNQITFLKKNSNHFQVLGSVVLDQEYSNLDLESLAAYKEGYYTAGSHSVSKGKKYNEGYFGIYQIKYNEELSKVEVKKATLKSIYENDSYLKEYFKKNIQDNGVNIEALAYKDGELVVGHRTPNVNGKTYVLKIDASTLFSDRIRYYNQPLELGTKGYGIKEITALDKGFVVIVSGKNLGTDFSLLYYWDGDFSRLNRTLDFLNGRKKIEGIEVLEQGYCYLKLFLLEDESYSPTSIIENEDCLF